MRVGQVRKRDANEKAIVAVLEAYGADVTRISGEGAPDLLVRYRGGLWAFEVKSKDGHQTDAQEDTNWPIIRSSDEALRLMGAMR